MHFGHVLTAMVTPFDVNGQIDLNRMTALIEFLLENGTDGLVINGTTAESPVLSSKEKEQIYRHVVEVVQKRVPVIAGTGSNDTANTIEATKRAEALGVDGIMLVTPYYNRPSQTGLYQHFKKVAGVTKLPIMLYHIPGRCSVFMEAETVIRLSEIDNIVALKDASSNLEHCATIIDKTKSEFCLYSGDDSMTLPLLSIGGTGVVSVVSHIIGRVMHEMVYAFMQGDIKKATALHLTYLPLMKGIFKAPSPAPIKAALRMNGLDVGSVRLPLVDLTFEEIQQLQEIMKSS